VSRTVINDSFLHMLHNSLFKSPFHFTLRELGSCNINRLCLPKNSSIVIWRRSARCHQFVRILGQCLGYVAGGYGDILNIAIFEPFFTRVLITQNS